MHNCDNCMTGRCPLCGGNAHRGTKIAAGWEMNCQECGGIRDYSTGVWRWRFGKAGAEMLDPDQSG